MIYFIFANICTGLNVWRAKRPRIMIKNEMLEPSMILPTLCLRSTLYRAHEVFLGRSSKQIKRVVFTDRPRKTRHESRRESSFYIPADWPEHVPRTVRVHPGTFEESTRTRSTHLRAEVWTGDAELDARGTLQVGRRVAADRLARSVRHGRRHRRGYWTLPASGLWSPGSREIRKCRVVGRSDGKRFYVFAHLSRPPANLTIIIINCNFYYYYYYRFRWYLQYDVYHRRRRRQPLATHGSHEGLVV